jgi:WD40 repeat protein
MGRRERPIDPDGGPIAEFAADLRQLREQAGRPSYRELARRASFSTTVLSEAAGGRSLPTLAVVRGYVRACGGDIAEWEERWRRAAELRRAEPPDAARQAPYLGLATYREEHASLFFGREALTRDLLRRLAAKRFLAVFGPSGSGKSSLLRAGLLAAVNHGDMPAGTDWTTILIAPGEQPAATLARQLESLGGTAWDASRDDLLTEPAVLRRVIEQTLADQPSGTGLLLVVDQFEELFTVCRDAQQRDCFVQALLAAAAADGARIRVVLGVRADFYAQCASWPELVTALRDAQVLVGPVDRDQLRDIIVKPAERTGMSVEGALVATALAETGTEPGALALVSHALLETWRNSPPSRLTLTAYQEAGGVPHAVAATAERVYAGCSPAQRAALRRIFLRLVALGDGTPDTRRRVAPDHLAAGDDSATAPGLIDKLAKSRLVTTDDGSVQLAHEALITFWPRLAGWLAEDREGLRVQRRLSGAAAEWARLERDPAALYRGTPLAVAGAWARQDAGLTGLTPLEREFLDASITAENATQAAAARAARRLRRLVAALVVLLVAVSAAGWAAAWQRENALSAEGGAISGQLAAQSASLTAANPDAAALAALAAWSAKPTVAARSALLSTACCTSPQTSLPGESADVTSVALSPGGGLLAAGGTDKTVSVWDTASGRQRFVLRGPTGPIEALAFSPSGDMLAAGSADGTITVWNPARPTLPRVLRGSTSPIEDIAFSPHGTLLASASADGRIRLRNPATGATEGELRKPGKPVRAIAFSPNGSTLATAGDDDTVTLWNIAAPAHSPIARTLTGATTAITDLAYSPGGTTIAGEETDGDVLIWNLNPSGTMIPLRHAADESRGLAFSRDGTVLITVSSYNDVEFWNTRTGRLAATENQRISGQTEALAYDPGSGLLALGGPAGNIQLWEAAVPPFASSAAPVTGLAIIPHPTMIASVSSNGALSLWNRDGTLSTTTSLASDPAGIAASPDGKQLAVIGDDGTVTLRAIPGLAPVQTWSTDSPGAAVGFSPDGRMLAAATRATITVLNIGSTKPRMVQSSTGGHFKAVAFSPDSGTVAAVTSEGAVTIWSTRTGRPVAVADPGTGPLDAIAFSPSGQILATGGNDGSITLWNAANLRPSAVLDAGASVRVLAFSPDGRILASGQKKHTIILWNTANWSLAATLHGAANVNALAFPPDGSTLISGDNSNHIITWQLDPAEAARLACQTLADDPGLTQAEALVPSASYARLCPSR